MTDQAGVIALLGASATHGGAPVECVETHTAVVFLAGPNAYKLKRAVHFDYLDFSTADRRRECCEEEVRRNRRTAPSLYRGVMPITREVGGGLALGGAGTPVDWVVHLTRFDQDLLLDRLAAAARLDLALMDPLGRGIAAFHAGAEPRRDRGGVPGMRFVIDGNAAGLAEYGDGLDAGAAQRLNHEAQSALGRAAVLLDRRREGGFVRVCHGDLHLGNIVLLDGHPTLFDAIEFNDDIACVDMLYDLAFLLMDLGHRGLPGHACAVWNAYLEETRDFGGLPLMPLLLSCRAAVRAKTTATAARVQHSAGAAEAMIRAARQYLSQAIDLLHPRRPMAIAIGGLSGSGKSTVAAALAPAAGALPGAVVIRSDVLRKRLCGVGRLDRLGPSGYTADVSRRVYQELAARVSEVLEAGHSVIADAVFARSEDRAAIEAAAASAGATLHGVWLDAPDRVLFDRLNRRQHDVSDADAAVVAEQRQIGPGDLSWPRIDASAPSPVVVERVAALARVGENP